MFKFICLIVDVVWFKVVIVVKFGSLVWNGWVRL